MTTEDDVVSGKQGETGHSGPAHYVSWDSAPLRSGVRGEERPNPLEVLSAPWRAGSLRFLGKQGEVDRVIVLTSHAYPLLILLGRKPVLPSKVTRVTNPFGNSLG